MRCALLCLLIVGPFALADDWPGWRGPRGDGTSTETNLPLRWSATENVSWKVPLPGTGHSSPVVSNDRVFVTSCREETKERLLLCLDRTDGKVVWERVVVTAPLEKKHKLNSYASSTPATDGQHVYVSFFAQPRVEVACYDFFGNKLWQRTPGEFRSMHGFCSPPVLYKGLVIINGDQDDAGAFLVALDKATGDERWRAARPGVRSYCPPTIFETDGTKQMVLSGSNHVASYDPDTGKRLWAFDGPTEQFVASFVYHDGLFFMTAGYPEYHMLAIDPKGNVVWRHTKGAGYVPAPVAWDHHFYLVKDDGLASCLVAKTGERPWTERLGKHHSASPVVADGYLYFTEDDGTTHVLKAGPKFEVVARNKLGEECYASPAISHGQLFIRTTRHLWCIGK
ncbi:MAG: PQQ-binding-like beta-propeller repeat protein [Gemmataceae bacterium]